MQEEAAEVERWKEVPHMVSASVFVRMGLKLEDQQYICMLQSKTRLTNLPGITTLPMMDSFDWTPVEIGKTFTHL